MLKNIFRIIVIGAIVIGAGWAFAWLSQNGGELSFVAFGREYRPSLLGVTILTAGVFALFYVLVKLIELLVALSYYVTGDKNALRRYFDQRGHKKGIDALNETVIAAASGDSKAALKNAYRADRYLDEPALTGLLIAEAAKREGKTSEVEAAYKQVLQSDKGRFAAIRGLMQGRLSSGDNKTAMQLAQEALSLKPNDAETIDVLYQLQIKAGDFQGARETLKSKIRVEKLPAPVARRREAVLSLAEAQTLDPETDNQKYRTLADTAFRIAPNLIPAALASARGAVAAGDKQTAAQTLAKAWAANPHRAIATAYGQLVEGEAPQDRIKRFTSFANRNKNHIETKLLLAELNISAGDFPAAKAALGDIANDPKTARQYTILAAIEHGMGGNEEVVRAYLAQASRAPRGAEWVCASCATVHDEWQAVCKTCERFDTIDWTENSADHNRTVDATPEFLLPLVTAPQVTKAIVPQ